MAVPIITVTRGGLVETAHAADICIVRDGELLAGVGDQERLVPMRSTVKPFVAHVVRTRSGADFTREELACLCASHNGEVLHQTVIRGLGDRLRLPLERLRLPAQRPIVAGLPYEPPTAGGLLLDPLQHNCSGNHLGVMALAASLGGEPADYWRADGPALSAVRDGLAEVVAVADTELVDGCGLPTYAVALTELARAYAALASDTGLAPVREAMLGHPLVVAGHGRVASDLLSAGVLYKDGFDGLATFGFSRGGHAYGVAVKVDDGSNWAAETYAWHLAAQWGLTTRAPARVSVNALGDRTGEIVFTDHPPLLASG